MKTRAPLVAAWVENMNGHLPHANKLSLHEVTEDGWLMREDLPEDSRDFCAGDGKKRILFSFSPINKTFQVVLKQNYRCFNGIKK